MQPDSVLDVLDVLDGTRLHCCEAVRAYWARQFAAAHPLVGLDRVRLDRVRLDSA